jgi:hypothetical protein
MRRRTFITLLGGAAACSPLAARAQQVAGRSYSLGVLTGVGRDTPHVGAMFDELQRAGFVEGQNLVIIGGFGMRADEFSQQAVIIANSALMPCMPAATAAPALPRQRRERFRSSRSVRTWSRPAWCTRSRVQAATRPG